MKQQHRTPRNRGAALLLVLVAMAISMILTTAFLDSRGGSVPMADGLDAASRARRAADSGLDLAMATIRANPMWHAEQRGGVLAESLDLDGAVIEVHVKDAETNGTPNALTRLVEVEAIADINGVRIGSRTMMDIPPTNPPLDLEFSEVGMLAEEHIRLEGQSVLVPWRPAAAVMGEFDPMLMGTLDGNPDSIHVGSDAVAVNGVKLMVDPRASNSGESRGGMHLLHDALPRINSFVPPLIDTTPVGDVRLEGAHAGDINAANIRITSNRELRITGDSILKSRGNLSLEPGARIIVESGCLVLDAAQRLHLDTARIDKSPSARIFLVARDRIDIRNSVIGPDDVEILGSGETEPNPQFKQVRIVDTGEGRPDIRIEGETRMMATIVASASRVRLQDAAVLYGRINANRIQLDDRATVFALPCDGTFVGLTATDGPHRNHDGSLHAAVTSPDRTDPAAMATLAQALGVCVVAEGHTAEPPAPAGASIVPDLNTSSAQELGAARTLDFGAEVPASMENTSQDRWNPDGERGWRSQVREQIRRFSRSWMRHDRSHR